MRITYFFVVLLVYGAVYVPTVSASTLTLQSNETNLHVGDAFYVDVVLDTKSKAINAVDIVTAFPSDLVSFVKAEDANSFVSLWVIKPKEREDGQVEFSGVTPGGVSGDNLSVARLHFKAHKQGQGAIQLSRSEVLLHDGVGTKDVMSVNDVHIAVTEGESQYNEKMYSDSEGPEPFLPIRISDPDVFDGQAFLIFETQDKNSGIFKYQVKEGYFGKYTDAVSPYTLKYQGEDKQVYVKAIDRVGNETIATVYPQDTGIWLQQHQHMFSILIVFISLCLLFFLYRIQRGKK